MAPRAPARQAAAAIAAALLLLLTAGAQACTTIIVGRDATTDGSIFMARTTDDSKPTNPWDLVAHGPKSYTFISNQDSPKGPFKYTIKDGMPYMAFALYETLLPDAHNPSVEEVGVNKAGVSVTSTESIYSSDAALAADAFTDDGVSEDAIASVILPLAKTAREGVQLLGSIIEKQGSSEGFGVGFTDANEAW